VTFADDRAARLYAAPTFARLLASRVDVLPVDPKAPSVLAMLPNTKMQQVARVAPRMVMGVFKDTRSFFDDRSPLKATVRTVPGQMRFSVKFRSEGDRTTFAKWMRSKADPTTLMTQYNHKVSAQFDGKPAGRVDVVAAGVGFPLFPEVRFYAKHSSPTTEVAIESTFEHDLYLAMRPQQGERFITLLAIVFPFVSFLWLGAIVMVLGGAICMWPVRGRATVPVASARPTVPSQPVRTA
jgi:hypothetical protein